MAGLPVSEAWAFFNNDPLAAAPRDAAAFRELLQRRGADVVEPPAPAAPTSAA
jgi:hypothetical protein